MRILIPLLSFILFFGPTQWMAQNSTMNPLVPMATATGDLDKDGIDEKVEIYTTADSSEYGLVRELQILKFTNGRWELWKSSRTAVLADNAGGVWGDPFSSLSITKGRLIIEHYGGSNWRWSTTDIYRFQNNAFQLIGYTSTFGKQCEENTSLDINLSTGKIIYTRRYTMCKTESKETITRTETETFYKKGLVILLENRTTHPVKLLTPKYKYEFEL